MAKRIPALLLDRTAAAMTSGRARSASFVACPAPGVGTVHHIEKMRALLFRFEKLLLGWAWKLRRTGGLASSAQASSGLNDWHRL